MPPFLLEVTKNQRLIEGLHKRLVYTKGEYRKEVRTTDWEVHLESHPFDNDPYCPGSRNDFLSHYNRIGNQPDEPFKSVTHAMLEQVLDDDPKYKNYNSPKLLNFYSYKGSCDLMVPSPACPAAEGAEFITTMQDYFRVPYPYKMQRLALPATPPLLNVRQRTENPVMSPCKFYDEEYEQNTRLWQKNKRDHWYVYNPILGINSDGTPVIEDKRKCVKLEY